jgi:NitT/TauT family transport system permease protein
VGRHHDLWVGSLTLAAVLGIWELLVHRGAVNPVLISAPSRIAVALGDLWTTGELAAHAWISGAELAVGFGLAILAGVPVGFAAALSDRVRWSIEPMLNALNATPTIALIPLIIIWFGIGFWDKVAIVCLGAFLQIALSTLAGLRLVNPNLLRVAQSFAATRRRTVLTVVVPSSVPFILIGLRLGLGRALVGVVAAEFVASTGGLGFMITRAGSYFQTAKVFAGILIVAAMGIVGTWLIRLWEQRVEAWRPNANA